LSGICGNTGGAWTSHTTATGGAWTSRTTAGEDQQTGGSGSSPYSLPVRTSGASPSHLQSNPTTQAVFHFRFPFSFRCAIISLR